MNRKHGVLTDAVVILLFYFLAVSAHAQETPIIIPELQESGFSAEQLMQRESFSEGLHTLKIPQDSKLEATFEIHGGAIQAFLVATDRTTDQQHKLKPVVGSVSAFAYNLGLSTSGPPHTFRVFFIGPAFYGSQLEGAIVDHESRIGGRSTSGEKSYDYNLKDLKLIFTYKDQNGQTYNTSNAETRWIKDQGGSPGYFAYLVVCEDKCQMKASSKPVESSPESSPKDKSEPDEAPKTLDEISEPAQTRGDVTVEVKFSEDATRKEETFSLHLLEQDQYYKSDRKIEVRISGSKLRPDEPGSFEITLPPGWRLTEESEGKLKIPLDEDIVTLQAERLPFRLELKPFTKIYGQKHRLRACKYKLTDPQQVDLKNKVVDGKFLVYADNLQPTPPGDSFEVKISVEPESERSDCIESELTTEVKVNVPDWKATGDLEVPQRNPWLLVYATSAQFPHRNNPNDDAKYRDLFWTRMFLAIHEGYKYKVRGGRSYWQTGDAYELLAQQQPTMLVGHELVPAIVEAEGPTNSLELSSEALRRLLSEVPERRRQPDFEEYDEQIRSYDELHSTAPKETSEPNTVVIVQGRSNFLKKICDDFKEFSVEQAEQGVRVLLVHPVADIRQSTPEQNILVPISKRVEHEDIYTCAQSADKPSNPMQSKLIVFNYYDHRDRSRKWEVLKQLLSEELKVFIK